MWSCIKQKLCLGERQEADVEEKKEQHPGAMARRKEH